MLWIPQPGPQSWAFRALWCDEIFYGGERGGGKSDYLLGYVQDGALRYGGLSRAIIFRQTYGELEELQRRALEIFPQTGAEYIRAPSRKRPFANCWYWGNGASAKMRYLERDEDYLRYHGHQYTHVAIDEAGNYVTPAPLLLMISTLRSAAGVPCTIRITGNGGGKGHGWLKERYIDSGPALEPKSDEETKLERMFVPAKLSDNKILCDADPSYYRRLMAATAGNDALRKAWMEGDWDIVAGRFFVNFSRERNVIEDRPIPKNWLRFRGFDWGSAAPFCVLWVAVSDGYYADIPPGALIVYREWYGARKSGSSGYEGLKMTAEAVAKGIVERDRGEHITYSVAGRDTFSNSGGPSIAERMRNKGVTWHQADNRRIPGWDQVSQRLAGDDKPMLFFTASSKHLLRTLPVLIHDATHIEDIDPDMEDHAAEALRYCCMSRPWVQASRFEEPRVMAGLSYLKNTAKRKIK